MRPGTCLAGSANRRGRGTATPSAGAGQAAGAGRPGGGSAASPSAPSRRRTAWGSVTAPTIRRGPAQRDRQDLDRPVRRDRDAVLEQQLGSLMAASPGRIGGTRRRTGHGVSQRGAR